MAISETQRLVASLDLKDNFTKTIAKAEVETAALDKTLTATSGRMVTGGGRMSRAVAGVERAFTGGRKALTHFGERITGLLGPLGLVGATGAALGLGVALDKGVHKASDMAFAVEKLNAITGEDVVTMSQLLFVTEKYGLDTEILTKLVGFTEKTLGKLTITKIKDGVATSKAIEFQKKYGVQIVDSHGKALAFSTILNHVADYYTSNARASDKAYVAATLFGRGFTNLVPILRLGSKGIKDAEDAAKELGLTLTKDNVKDLTEFRNATREAGEAVGGLELQIGLAAVPAIKDLANSITDFLRHGGREKLVAFFKEGLAFARGFAGFVGGTLIPTVQKLAGVAGQVWSSIPEPVRNLLAKGFIADRTIKFLFGISPIKLVVDVAENTFAGFAKGIATAIGAAVGGQLLASKAIVQPVFVTNQIPGVGGGIAGVGKGLLGTAASLVSKVVIVGMVAEVADLIHGAISPGGGLEGRTQSGNLLPGDKLAWPFGPKNTPHIDLGPFHNILGGDSTFSVATPGLNALLKTSPVLDRGGREPGRENFITTIGGFDKRIATAVIQGFTRAIGALRAAKTGEQIAAAVREVLDRTTKKNEGNLAGTKSAISALKDALKRTTDPRLRTDIKAAIARVEAKLPGREFAARQIGRIDKLIGDGRITRGDLKQIQSIERALKDRGLPHAAAMIEQKVDNAKNAIARAEMATARTIASKNFSPTIILPKPQVTIREYANGVRVVTNYNGQTLMHGTEG
jgi:hypothetical protein